MSADRQQPVGLPRGASYSRAGGRHAKKWRMVPIRDREERKRVLGVLGEIEAEMKFFMFLVVEIRLEEEVGVIPARLFAF